MGGLSITATAPYTSLAGNVSAMVSVFPTTHYCGLIGPSELFARTLADQQDSGAEFGIFLLFLGQKLTLGALFSTVFIFSCAGLAM